jgi:hypothetical protein
MVDIGPWGPWAKALVIGEAVASASATANADLIFIGFAP